MMKKTNNFWLKFRDRFNYHRNYKEYLQNEEYKDAEAKQLNEQIEKLNDNIKELTLLNKVKDELLEKSYSRIGELNIKVSQLMKDLKDVSGESKKIAKNIKKIKVKKPSKSGKENYDKA